MKSAHLSTAILCSIACLAALTDSWALGIPFQDVNGDGAIVLLAFGDSTTLGTGDGSDPRGTPPPPAGYPARLEILLDAPVVNAGKGGEQTEGGRSRLPGVLAQVQPDFVILLEGVNNVIAGNTGRLIGDLQAMVDAVLATGALPILGTLTPTCCEHSDISSTVRAVSSNIRSLAASNGIPTADFFSAFAPSGTYSTSSGLLHAPEGLHPRPAGYDAMAVTVANLFVTTGDTIGLFRPDSAVVYLKNSNRGGFADVGYEYGPPGAGWIPVAGDWNGDGTTTLGLFDPGASVFYLRNSNTAGFADVSFPYGPPGAGWIPVAGDWDANGTTTVGLFDPSQSVFYLRNSNSGGFADLTFPYGPPGAGSIPLAGDWNGDAVGTIGIFDPVTGVFRLRNSNDAGFANSLFAYAPSGSGGTPLGGDWNGDGVDTIGVFYPGPSRFFLRNSNTGGGADLIFDYGLPGAGWLPLGGNWDGL
ncbi:MAG: SGNH/GDSL hydrolase family protein [Candidatus Binatia bacterium]